MWLESRSLGRPVVSSELDQNSKGWVLDRNTLQIAELSSETRQV